MTENRCGACLHPAREAIEAALTAGTPVRAVARRHAIGRGVLARHLDHWNLPAPADPDPGLLDPDPGRRTLAAYALALDALDRAEAEGRLPLMLGAIRGARAGARQVVSLYRGRGDVSEEDRAALEGLYVRTVNAYSRCVGHGGIELSALGALRGILDDLRDAAGEVEGEIEIVVRFADGSAIGESGRGVIVPASKLPPAYREGGRIELSFAAGPHGRRALPYEEPPESGNGHGRPWGFGPEWPSR